MSTNQQNAEDAIAEFEAIQIKDQYRRAIKRLDERFADLEQHENGLSSARALIEHVHLIAGNRRQKHVSIDLDRRGGQQS